MFTPIWSPAQLAAIAANSVTVTQPYPIEGMLEVEWINTTQAFFKLLNEQDAIVDVLSPNTWGSRAIAPTRSRVLTVLFDPTEQTLPSGTALFSNPAWQLYLGPRTSAGGKQAAA